MRRLECRIHKPQPPGHAFVWTSVEPLEARGWKVEGVGSEVPGEDAQWGHNVWQAGFGNIKLSPAALEVTFAGGENVPSPTGPSWSRKFCRRWGHAHLSGKTALSRLCAGRKNARTGLCTCVYIYECMSVHPCEYTCVRVQWGSARWGRDASTFQGVPKGFLPPPGSRRELVGTAVGCKVLTAPLRGRETFPTEHQSGAVSFPRFAAGGGDPGDPGRPPVSPRGSPTSAAIPVPGRPITPSHSAAPRRAGTRGSSGHFSLHSPTCQGSPSFCQGGSPVSHSCCCHTAGWRCFEGTFPCPHPLPLPAALESAPPRPPTAPRLP